MLGKLMKYEFKSTARILLPLYGTLFACALINRVFQKLIPTHGNDAVWGIGWSLTVGLYIVAIIAVFVVTLILLIQRFYKNLLGDEGYLMHTLPVKPWQHITSKLIAATVWSVLSGIVFIISLAILFFDLELYRNLFSDLGNVLSKFYSEYSFNGVALILEALLTVLTEIVHTILFVYASIAIGSLFHKHRVAASFGAFLVLNFVVTLITSLLSIFGVQVMDFMSFMSLGHIAFGAMIAINISLSIIWFIVANRILKRRLNLQ